MKNIPITIATNHNATQILLHLTFWEIDIHARAIGAAFAFRLPIILSSFWHVFLLYPRYSLHYTHTHTNPPYVFLNFVGVCLLLGCLSVTNGRPINNFYRLKMFTLRYGGAISRGGFELSHIPLWSLCKYIYIYIYRGRKTLYTWRTFSRDSQ